MARKGGRRRGALASTLEAAIAAAQGEETRVRDIWINPTTLRDAVCHSRKSVIFYLI